MKIKTLIKNLESLDKKVITKSAILSVAKYLNSIKFDSNNTELNRLQAQLLIDLIEQQKDGFKITKEQKEFGINWLKKRYFQLNGKERKQAMHDFGCFDSTEIDIIRNFKEFRFVGFTANYDNYSRVFTNFKPIYRVIAKNGQSFDYAAVYFGPVIINPEITNSIN